MSEDKPRTVQEMRSPQQLAVVPPPGQIRRAGVFDFHNTEVMGLAIDMAQKLVRSEMVPDIYRRKHDNDQGALANCLIALDLADRMGANPIMVMQNLSVINGRPAWSGQYIIAAINQSGRFAEPLHFEFFGEEGTLEYGCFAETTTRSGRTIRGPKITMRLAKDEGWMKNPKWTNMPDLMLRYRAGAWFGKTECPELLMGIQNSAEEAEDIAIIDSETGEVLNKKPEPKNFVDMQADFKAKTTLEDKVPETVDEGKAPAAKKETAKEESKPEPEKKVVEENTEPEPDSGDEKSSRAAQLEERGFYEDGNRFFNAAGDIWNPSKHAKAKTGPGPVVNADGSFRARRGVAAAAVNQEEVDPIPDNKDHPGQQQQADDDDDLGDWE